MKWTVRGKGEWSLESSSWYQLIRLCFIVNPIAVFPGWRNTLGVLGICLWWFNPQIASRIWCLQGTCYSKLYKTNSFWAWLLAWKKYSAQVLGWSFSYGCFVVCCVEIQLCVLGFKAVGFALQRYKRGKHISRSYWSSQVGRLWHGKTCMLPYLGDDGLNSRILKL